MIKLIAKLAIESKTSVVLKDIILIVACFIVLFDCIHLWVCGPVLVKIAQVDSGV
jgi:hypothetical protein